MDNKDLPALLDIMKARYQVQQQAFQKLLAKETALRSELRRIDDQVRASQHRNDPEMKAIGADVIWKAWVGRTKRRLNMELAQVLAQKEHHVRQVKRAFGKVLVTEDLLKNHTEGAVRKRSREDLSRAIEQSLRQPRPDQ